MFLPENPIDKFEEDFLGRKTFAKHLANSITNWKEKKSLVIALYGKWGIGKTSLINMTIDYINNNFSDINKPTIVRFNPWAYSETDNLLEGFIGELVTVIKRNKKTDKKLIKKLEYYSKLLSLSPSKNELKITYNSIFSIIALAGITVSQIKDFIENVPGLVSNIMLWIGVGYFGINILTQLFKKILNYNKIKSEYESKSINEVKKDIIEILEKKAKKLVIMIDDIDRLSNKEIRQIFRIIRTNADFPNTIYLTAFDREIIEKNLEVQNGISGHDYLEKIVQVNFTLPHISPTKIQNYLLHELNQLLDILPESANNFFNNDSHWVNLFHSGFKFYFKSIRDVKRYINALEFNITQLIKEDVIEVNPIDFFAIELIRLFEPNYYKYLLNNKSLYSDVTSSNRGTSNDKRKELLNESFDMITSVNRDHLKGIIFQLFPQVKGLVGNYGNYVYGYESVADWTRNLRICSEKIFDSYFNFIPGGDENEIGMYDLKKISEASNNQESFKELLEEYKSSKKFENFLIKIQDFTSENNFFKKSNFEFIILHLFDLFLDLPDAKPNFYGIGLDMQIIRIIFQLLSRNENLDENFSILKHSILNSESIWGPIQFISIEVQKLEKEESSTPLVISTSDIDEAKKLCVKKIKKYKDQLLDDSNLLYLLYRWKNWDDGDELKQFLNEITSDNKKFLNFFDKFEYETTSHSIGSYGVQKHRRFRFKELANYYDLEEIKIKIENIKDKNNDYLEHKSSIDLFLKYFDRRNQDLIFDWDE